VTTGVEPATCDADGDGVTDPGAPSSCSSPAAPSDTGATGSIEQGGIAPLPYSARKKHKAAPKAPAKKKVRQRRASAR